MVCGRRVDYGEIMGRRRVVEIDGKFSISVCHGFYRFFIEQRFFLVLVK